MKLILVFFKYCISLYKKINSFFVNFQEAYTAFVSETASAGTVVTTITASDRDTQAYGTEGIKYSLFGNGADK